MNTVQTAEPPKPSHGLAILLERRGTGQVERADAGLVLPLHRPWPGRREDEPAIDADDELRPVRGFVNGILVAMPLWGLIGMLTWFVLG